MTESAEASFELLKNKAEQVFDPNFFGVYSFEYAYRLFLVFLSTNKFRIREIRASDPNALDHAFESYISAAISYTANYRGVQLNQDALSSLLKLANDSAVLFVKSPSSTQPNKLAKSVAKAMNKQAAESLGDGKKLIVPTIFTEETEAR